MKQAIKNAFYYSNITPSYLENPLISFDYDDANSFKFIADEYQNCINTITTFGDEKSMCYQILITLPYCYNKLLIYNLSSLYIVNRKDICMKLNNQNNVSDQIRIIKIDSDIS